MLTLQYIPHHEFSHLVLEDKLLIEGRLDPIEESELIKRTMSEINKNFSGIEIASIDYDLKKQELWDHIRKGIANLLLKRRSGLTIVGPASIVREIKKDPNKIELLTMEKKKKR